MPELNHVSQSYISAPNNFRVQGHLIDLGTEVELS